MILLPGTLALLLGFSLLICKTEAPGLASCQGPFQFHWHPY